MSVGPAAVSEDFDGFYSAHFGDTVAMAYTFTSDIGEAQDIAQEAFCRAWRRWAQISSYDNPVAWIRRVATNLAHSRWRRLKLAASVAFGQELREVPALNPDYVAVVEALRKLPVKQREAVVLHHIMDLPVVEVAEHFDVPVGTVKSWLHRGRAALADDLRLDVRADIVTPPVDSIARRSGRVRGTVLAAIAVVLALGAYLVVQLGRSDVTPPVPPGRSPAPSPSPSPVVDPSDPILSVDWVNTAILVELPGSSCPGGKVQLRSRAAGGFVGGADGKDIVAPSLARMAFGDLNGDDRAEAVLPMTCMPRPGSLPAVYDLAVIERRADGTLAVIAMTTEQARPATDVWISSGVIYAYTGFWPVQPDRLGDIWAWRLAKGKALHRLDGSAGYPDIRHLNLSPLASGLPCGSAQPQPDLRLSFDKHLLARAGERELSILRPGEKPVFDKRGRQHLPYLVLTIGCRPTGTTGWYSTVVIFDRINDEWRAIETA